MKRKPRLVSVIVPFYKELDLIDRAARSVLEQDLPPDTRIEVLIGNDSGLDERMIRPALSAGSNAVTAIVPNHAGKGAGNARNAALDAAQGEIIAFLDADDYWRPNKLRVQLDLLDRGASFVTGAYRFEGSSKIVVPPAQVASTVDLFRKLGVGTSTVVITRAFLGKERFRNFRFSQDTELWARLAGKPGFRFASVPDVVAVYAPSGRTANKFRQFFAFADVVNAFPLSYSVKADIYLRYAVRGVYNHYLRR